MANAGFWASVISILTKLLHHITGHVVHPDKGGCCYEENKKEEK